MKNISSSIDLTLFLPHHGSQKCAEVALIRRVTLNKTTNTYDRNNFIAASEIQLRRDSIFDAKGKVAKWLDIRSRIAKGNSGRRVPMYADLANAITALLRECDGICPVILSASGRVMRPNSIANWFVTL